VEHVVARFGRAFVEARLAREHVAVHDEERLAVGAFQVEQLRVKIEGVEDRRDAYERCLVEFEQRHHDLVEHAGVHGGGFLADNEVSAHPLERLHLARVGAYFAHVFFAVAALQPQPLAVRLRDAGGRAGQFFQKRFHEFQHFFRLSSRRRKNANFAAGDGVQVRGHVLPDRPRLAEAPRAADHDFLARLRPAVFLQDLEVIPREILAVVQVPHARGQHRLVEQPLVLRAVVADRVEPRERIAQRVHLHVALGRLRVAVLRRVQRRAPRDEDAGFPRVVFAAAYLGELAEPRQQRPHGPVGPRAGMRSHAADDGREDAGDNI
jgi:hypothetical protein